jgi:hypothetical protein
MSSTGSPALWSEADAAVTTRANRLLAILLIVEWIAGYGQVFEQLQARRRAAIVRRRWRVAPSPFTWPSRTERWVSTEAVMSALNATCHATVTAL